MKNRFKICGICLAAITFSVSAAYADISINGYTDETNDRFTNSSSFIGNGYNLSGVGQTNGGTSGTAGNWATAISRNVCDLRISLSPPISMKPSIFIPIMTRARRRSPGVLLAVKKSLTQTSGLERWTASFLRRLCITFLAPRLCPAHRQ